jgi:hypothetical protein
MTVRSASARQARSGIKYSGGGTCNGLCVGDNSSTGYGHLVGCNSTGYPGTGGGTATIFVQWHGDGSRLNVCDTSFNHGINSHYTSVGGGNWVTGLARPAAGLRRRTPGRSRGRSA